MELTQAGDVPRARVALLGAFPFPARLGSQVFAAEQAAALRRAGAAVTFFCHATGEGRTPEGVEVVRTPRALSPVPVRSGPAVGRPLADAALLATFLRALRRRRFAVVLAHNAEAALVALAARAAGGPPVVYVAHTLLGEELDAWAPRAGAGVVRRAGRALDAALARRCDAVQVLSPDAEAALRPLARGPVAVLPPGLDPAPAPDEDAIRRACRRAGVEPGRFAFYSGNLDRYQELPILLEAARALPELPLVIATHGAARVEAPGVRCVRTDATGARALAFGCTAAVLTRRRAGGFPVKLLRYLESGRPLIAREGIAPGLAHDRTAWLVARDAGARAFADALHALSRDPARCARIGTAARAHLESHHGWPALARGTLALVERTLGGSTR